MKRINMLLARLHNEYNLQLTVESYSPGDGWTRYSIHTREGYRLNSCLTRSECELALSSMLEVLNYRECSVK